MVVVVNSLLTLADNNDKSGFIRNRLGGLRRASTDVERNGTGVVSAA